MLKSLFKADFSVMPSKLEILKSLSKEQLRKAALAEGIKLSKDATKKEIILKLSKLPLSKIKEIAEKYGDANGKSKKSSVKKRKSSSKRASDKQRVKVNEGAIEDLSYERERLIAKLVDLKVKLHPVLVREIGRIYGFQPLISEDINEVYRSFSLDALRAVYESFVEKSVEGDLRYMAYRVAQWILNRVEGLSSLNILEEDKSPILLFYDKRGRLIVVAKCLADKREVEVDDVKTWIEEIKRRFRDSKGSLRRAYLIALHEYSADIKEALFKLGIGHDGFMKVRRAILKVIDGGLALGVKEGVYISLCIDRLGDVIQIFP